MTDEESIKQAVETFHNLSEENVAKLKEINEKIQNHTGSWGTPKTGADAGTNAAMAWLESDMLIYEFLDFMEFKNLLPIFEWRKWDEGLELFNSKDPAKYDNLDVATTLKLSFFAARKEHFKSGALVEAFESGELPKLINRLTYLK